MNLKALLASSSDAKQLSMTIKGFLALLVVPAGLLINLSGHQVDNEQLKAAVEAVGETVSLIGSAVSSVLVVGGILRKLYYSIK